MKHYKVILFYIIYALWHTAAFAQQDTCSSIIEVSTDRDSSVITLNGKTIGYGRAIKEIPVGNYIIEAREGERSWGGNIFSDTLKLIGCGERIEYNYNFDDQIYLNTSPADVSVIYRDTIIGKTPLFLNRDFGQLTLQKKNYTPLTVNINSYKPGETLSMEYIGGERKKSFISKPAFKYLIGGIAVLGTVAAYFKVEADNNYDRYLDTRDKKYLDKTDSYDLISGISFGALQINLGFLAYMLLSD